MSQIILIQSHQTKLLTFAPGRLGVGLANILPNKERSFLGWKYNLNPGPFNVKEHTIITMMTAAGSTYSYAIDILLAQEVFYKQRFG